MSLYAEYADLYEAAFSWDIDSEADWLAEQLGVGPLLEPGCGAGRFLVALSRRGIEVTGIDQSEAMVELANARLGDARGRAIRGDMTAFQLPTSFRGAYCPVGTIAHVDGRDNTLRHLQTIRSHLAPGSTYLVQLDLRDPRDPWREIEERSWQLQFREITISATWTVREIDLPRARELHHSRLEVLTGPRAGLVVEDDHVMTTWMPEAWLKTIGAAGFRLGRAYDSKRMALRTDPYATPGEQLWHALVA